jgi:uncharacterized protein YjcR
MNDVQTRLVELQKSGWTLAAIADELGVTVNAVEKWKAADRYPTNVKAINALLDSLAVQKAPVRKRRGSNSREIQKGHQDENK